MKEPLTLEEANEAIKGLLDIIVKNETDNSELQKELDACRLNRDAYSSKMQKLLKENALQKRQLAKARELYVEVCYWNRSWSIRGTQLREQLEKDHERYDKTIAEVK